MIRLLTLGPIRITSGDEDHSATSAQRMRCALLVFVAIERKTTREALCNLLWPERDEEKGRRALTQTLYELRRTFGDDWLESHADALQATEQLSVDVIDFERAVAAGDLARALDLYTGAFLENFFLPESKAFEAWVDQQRGHLSRLHRKARRERVAQLVASGEIASAVEVTRAWVKLEPAEDEAQHRLIELLAQSGDRAEALRQYDRYEKLLAADDLQPLDETKALMARLREGEFSARPPKQRVTVHAPYVPGADVGAALAGRYSIQREVSRRGNTIVYLARDEKHDRLVALKVLLPDLAATVIKDRFLREIRIAAKLNHPHILPLYDSGEADRTLYFVMPYVTGESLRDRLVRERQLSLENALRITREVAGAVAYAHTQGVVHRNIKPENILFQDGAALIADFGIARALLEVRSEPGLTPYGIVIGTPDYMSPEQAAGSSAIDGRSDLYALGCVLYQMLAGHPPFTGVGPHEVLARHVLDPVPRLTAARPDVPEPVERALLKALAKLPADRFDTALDFAGALGPPTGERPPA
jgi:DNA-binding SARP family transcriptional activator